jgi:small conductance mechanosensitive channel
MKLFGLYIPKEIYMPIIIIIGTLIVQKIRKIVIKKVFNSKRKMTKYDTKKVSTIKSFVDNIFKYTIWIIAIILLLDVYGINTTALIIGSGVVSLVAGLAFQDMLKDVLVGVSILFENQFAVGDLIKIGDFTGTVISLGLKTTKLQAYTGEVKIISNRNITELINYSVDKTLAVVDLAVSYESKIEKVEKILLVAAATMKEKIDNLAGDIELLGVQELSDSAVIFRIVAKCKPAKHFEVERQLKKEFKNVLDKNGVKIPYTQIEVHNEK